MQTAQAVAGKLQGKQVTCAVAAAAAAAAAAATDSLPSKQ